MDMFEHAASHVSHEQSDDESEKPEHYAESESSDEPMDSDDDEEYASSHRELVDDDEEYVPSHRELAEAEAAERDAENESVCSEYDTDDVEEEEDEESDEDDEDDVPLQPKKRGNGYSVSK